MEVLMLNSFDDVAGADRAARRLQQGLRRAGVDARLLVQFRYGQALGRDFTVADLARDHEAVFLAPGLWSGRRLDLEGGQAVRAVDALGFLCAFRERGKAEVGAEVLVVGGGSVAMDAALAARGSGAGKVTLVCLEKEVEMPALAGEVAELRRQGVEILNGWGPRAFVSANRVSLVGCDSVFDAQGRFSPCYDESRTMELGFDQLIWAVGQSAEPFLAGYLHREFGFNGRLEVDPETLQVAGREAVFAGGDIVRGAGTVVEAVADGRRAAKGIHALLGRV